MSELSCERLILGKFPSRVENEHLARYCFATELVRGKQVVDVACGSGYGTLVLAQSGAERVCGLDVSKEAIAFSRAAHQAPNLSYAIADAQMLAEVGDSIFDVVISFETLEHIRNVHAYLDEMKRILRPGGLFLVSTPDRRITSVLHCFLGRPQNPYHVREYTERELLELLSTRFEITASYGQEFVSRWLVFWPVQFFVKVFFRLIGATKGSRLRNYIYGDRGNVAVIEKTSRTSVPNFWIFACSRPGNV